MNESQKKGNKKSKQNTEYWDKITCKERFFPRISRHVWVGNKETQEFPREMLWVRSLSCNISVKSILWRSPVGSWNRLFNACWFPHCTGLDRVRKKAIFTVGTFWRAILMIFFLFFLNCRVKVTFRGFNLLYLR